MNRAIRLLWLTAVMLLMSCTAVPSTLPTTPILSPTPTLKATLLPPPAVTTLTILAPTVTQLPNTPLTPSPTSTNTPYTGTQTIPGDDPRISYIGRFDFSQPAAPTFDWPGATIEATFSGYSLTVLLEDGANWYNVYVDGLPAVLQTRSGQEAYLIASELGAGVHTVRLVKRTESMVGQARFKGFILSPGGMMAAPPLRSERGIEFIGDSITAAYGVEGESATCPFSVATQNVEQSYAGMVARAVRAEYMVTAVSGIGVIRNYNESDMISDEPMSVRFQRTLANEPRPVWDFQQWRPDLVVINLGTNDFSTDPQPTQAIFVQAYIDFLNDIRRHYPLTPIIAVAGPIIPDYVAGYVETAVIHLNTAQNDPNVHFLPIPNTLSLASDYGCDYHPNIIGQQKIANYLLPKIREVMNAW